ncbi:M48 family metallopeptidase [Sphingomonas azotifigens]|uniref:M48 family metallopeptidase n=1 Tax=Sphingomonas azotifigens TaxID=330920 RepID=UPI001FE9327C|nr:M48 family metallopeptidase [Sphingomonas azotifigens]
MVETRVWHYDGQSRSRRMPTIVPGADETQFLLQGDGAEAGPYAFADLVPQGQSHHERAFGLKNRPGWQITFLEFPPSEIAVHLPKLPRYHAWLEHFGPWRIAGVLALLVGLTLLATLKFPPLIARSIPQSVEERMGAKMVASMGAYACSSPAGDAALKALAARLRQGDNVTIRVLHAPMVNAVAFPGHQVVLFDGFIQEAQSPDEIAGVLAHELGHLAHQDGMEALVRHFGIRLLLGGFDRHPSSYANALLNARYSRKAEVGADSYAIGRLQGAGISPGPTAALFTRMAEQDEQPELAGRLLNYLSSHPPSPSRAQRFTQSVQKNFPYRPALDAAQWQALRTMCAKRG